MPAPARGLRQSQPRPFPPTKFAQSSRHPLATQIQRPSVQSASTADGASEAVDLSVSLLPNFRASRAIVAIAVGDVVELICPECPVWLLRVQLLSEATRIASIVAGIGIGHGRYQTQIGAA